MVADQVDGHNRYQKRDSWVEADPVFARQHVLVTVGDQQTERRFGDGHAQAEEGKGRLQRDGTRNLLRGALQFGKAA